MAMPNGRPLVILLLLAAVQCCSGFCFRPISRTLVLAHGIRNHPHTRHQLPGPHYLSGNDDDDGKDKTNDADDDRDKNSYSWAELQADEELRQIEFKSSMKRKNNILLPQRISQAVTTLGWAFVIGGFVLNSVGFAWVKDPSGGIGIGSLDERDFQREIIRERRKDTEGEKKPPLAAPEIDIANKAQVVSWVEKQQNSGSA
eukprot:CAMPEP_0201629430 /NCGR_PEP_ID=MMETSP0493-20130528/4106_1 /ASSEMBLY_ACC=CAM_ASM_000838 /TAXON_ID=420259 /ORGANISM="Thalassiosira gravida, Strain GMp14c1" /LENGTH=200 /DNA_ID=CAMNT_0048100437 /DNA_START=6 /DNA_END=608 /DNA_ORIENTATION=-